MSKKSKAMREELKRTNPKKYRRMKFIGYSFLALFVVIMMSWAFEDENNSEQVYEDAPVIAKEEKEVEAKQEDKEDEPIAEEVAAKEKKKEPVDPYEEARKESGGYLPKVELEDALSAAKLRAEITKTNPVANHVAVWATVETNLTTKMTYKSARMAAVEIFEVLSTLDNYETAAVIISAPGTDAYGNDIDMEALKVTWTKETIDKVNYGQFDVDNIGSVAKAYSTTE